MKATKTARSIGMVLAGCGAWDGSDIHETVLTQLALDHAGAAVVYAAPEMAQLHVLNHLSHEEMPQTRQVTVESARLARSEINDLRTFSADNLDAVILPGGQGAIKQLSEFAIKGPLATVNGHLRQLLVQMAEAKKPIGAISLAAITVAQALGANGPTVTIGNDMGTAAAIESLGAQHRSCHAHQICLDRANRIVTTPGYMVAKNISQVFAGIEKMVSAVLEMIV